MIFKLYSAFIFILIICVAVEAIQVFNYNVTVKTASTPKFTSHKGKLKFSLFSVDKNSKYHEDYVLTPNNVKLANNRLYVSNIGSFAILKNVTSCYLRWTLASPYNPINKIRKPSIYFDPIILNSTYVDPHTNMLVTKSRKFCPPTSPVEIKHGKGSTFYPCN